MGVPFLMEKELAALRHLCPARNDTPIPCRPSSRDILFESNDSEVILVIDVIQKFRRSRGGVFFLPGKKCLNAASYFSQKKGHPTSGPSTQAPKQPNNQIIPDTKKRPPKEPFSSPIGDRFEICPRSSLPTVRYAYTHRRQLSRC
jgi:hypothetical protein